MRPFPNRFPGYCDDCGEELAAGEGVVVGRDGDFWIIKCRECHFGPRWSYCPPPPRREPPPPATVPACLLALALKPPVTAERIKRRYRLLTQDTHPDHGGDPREFIALRNAYEQAMSLVGANP